MAGLLVSRLLFVLFVGSNLCNCVTYALPLITTVKRDVTALEVPPPEILRFMRRFGYLEPNPGDSEALYHESAIVEAIKNVQKYGALNQTGKLDNMTLHLLSKPRCGVPDIEGTPYYLAASSTTQPTMGRDKEVGQQDRVKRFVIGAPTWTKRRIRYFIANSSFKVPKEQVKQDISRAFALWSRYSGLRFLEVNNTSADIIVGFGSGYHGDNYPFDGAGNILAHAFYPYEMGSWGGDVHFDEDENWKENSTDLTNGVDFYSVAVHELGHSLGLAHSPVYNSIMFPYYKGPEHNTLDYDDTLAMYEMYLNKELEDDIVSESLPTTTEEQWEKATTTSSVVTEETLHTDVTPTFQGDFETVTKHKNHYAFITPTSSSNQPNAPTTHPLWPNVATKPIPNEVPVICRGNFDAVAVINGSVLIFKQEYVWKLTDHYTTMNGYPVTIYEEFPFLPSHIKRIDAAYERYDGAAVFFTGQTFWVFNGSEVIEGSPKSLTNLIGAETIVQKVDAAMMWPKNNDTYIFAGAKFWRYNDRIHMLNIDYPKSIKRWPGIPNNIDAAATLINGKTYFFKNNLYWLYDNVYVRPERGYPRRASSAWLGCPPATKTPLRNINTTVAFISSFAWT